MEKLIVDLDDVLALDGYLNMMNDFCKTNYTYEDTKGYYVEELLDKDQLITYRDFFKNNNVYDYAVVAPNSQDVLMNLMTEYEIYVCSSYHSDIDNIIMPELIPKKCEFLKKNYPFLTSKNFIFTNDKSIIRADVKIDDVLNNLTNGDIKILYTAYHNKDLPKLELVSRQIVRMNDWNSIAKLLKKTKK